MIREVCRIGKTGFQIYGTFKGSFLGYMGRTIECETFFKFRRTGKGFVEKIRNIQSIVSSPDGFVFFLRNLKKVSHSMILPVHPRKEPLKVS